MAAESWDELETCLQKADLAPPHCKGGLELDLRRLAVVWGPGQRSCGLNMWRLNNSFQVGPGCFALYGPAWRLRFKWRSAVGGGDDRKDDERRNHKRGVRPEPECSRRRPLSAITSDLTGLAGSQSQMCGLACLHFALPWRRSRHGTH